MNENLFTTRDVARLLGVSEYTVTSWRRPGRNLGPEYVKIGGQVRYRESSVRAYIEARGDANTGKAENTRDR